MKYLGLAFALWLLISNVSAMRLDPVPQGKVEDQRGICVNVIDWEFGALYPPIYYDDEEEE